VSRVFPVYYRPRPYQEELHHMWRTKRYGIAVLPRQSGKDVAASMEQCDARLKTGKTTGVYISLNNPTIRDILWQKTYYDLASQQFIKGLQDNVPEDLVDWRDTAMEGRFKNGSRLKLQGYFQSGADTSGVGSAFQDYTITELALFHREDPIPRLIPILDNEHEQKRLMAVSTPRGKRKNPLWQLMESMKDNPQAQIILRTIDDLNAIMAKNGLPPVRTAEQLELTRDAYLKRFGNDRMFEQEYFCSFEEMDAAAVYGEAYMKLITEGRAQRFNLNTGHPVYVVFDIGASGMHSDATSWIVFQYINGRIFIYDCGEGHGKAVPEYVDVLREKHYFSQIAQMILPWDAEHHEKAVNTTPADMMRLKFPNISVLAKSNKVYKIPGSRQGDYDLITDIQQARLALYNTIINEENCQLLMECFENYKYAFDNKRQEWTNKPLHDRYSHLMDAYRYLVQATKELDFFGGQFFEQPGGQQNASADYVQDYAGVWRR
jgi:hypothetical protein